MQHHSRWETAHRRALAGAITVACLTVALVGVARLTGAGLFYEPQSEPVASAQLLFTDEADGVVAVHDAATGARLIEYGEDEGVFVRSVMRGVARQRRMRGEGAQTPVELSRLGDGQLWLIDPVSEMSVYLGAFGRDNHRAFAEILEREEAVGSADEARSAT